MAEQKDKRIRIIKNGPYRVTDNIALDEKIITPGPHGYSYETRRCFRITGDFSLCRCGRSRKKPFCDGSHLASGFDGTETASRAAYDDQAVRIAGPGLIMADNLSLCALVRFCHQQDGDAWSLTENSDCDASRSQAIQAACDCASGRLTAIDKSTGQVIEPVFEPSISLLQDPEENCSGPLFVKGGIPVESADGKIYEIRNRMTLCRCGGSRNKPFCDSTHLQNGFQDSEQPAPD